MNRTIEQQTSDSILQKKKAIMIGQKEYLVAPPTLATIIEVSAIISELPNIELKPKSIFIESMIAAKDCLPIGKAMAMIILGAGHTTKTEMVTKKRFFGFSSYTEETTTDLLTPLAHEILNDIPILEISNVMAELLMGLEFDHFFQFTTSLTEINLLRATREVGKTTPSGH